jgi:uncharacterized protein
MPRPKCMRTVSGTPDFTLFKPAGVPASSLEEIVLTVDEFEAIRLADREGLYYDEAADVMNISRQTFGRIVQSARQKTAEALVEGKALRIDGGTVHMIETRNFQCDGCGHGWETPLGTGRPSSCPQCRGATIHRSVHQSGPLESRRCRRGVGCGRSQTEA